MVDDIIREIRYMRDIRWKNVVEELLEFFIQLVQTVKLSELQDPSLNGTDEVRPDSSERSKAPEEPCRVISKKFVELIVDGDM